MVIKDNIPFPQADDFNKIMLIVNIDKESDLRDKEKISELLGNVAYRQVQYYLSACMYLGIIDRNKELTEFGFHLRNLNILNQEILLATKIISYEIFGYVFFLEKKLKMKMTKEDVVEVMKNYISFDSEGVYDRRAQTIIKWLEWINQKFEM